MLSLPFHPPPFFFVNKIPYLGVMLVLVWSLSEEDDNIYENATKQVCARVSHFNTFICRSRLDNDVE